MRISRVLCALVVMTAFAAPAHAELLMSIDKSVQRMTVAVDGETRYVWPVSTGAPSYDTPSGEFKPFRMEAEHFSREWDDAPMLHSIFFTMQGHAIHGSGHVKAIGTPASHGCVRLEPKNATILFALVKREKMANTRVELTGETPTTVGVPVARREPNTQRRSNTDYQRSYSNDQFDPEYAAAPPTHGANPRLRRDATLLLRPRRPVLSAAPRRLRTAATLRLAVRALNQERRCGRAPPHGTSWWPGAYPLRRYGGSAPHSMAFRDDFSETGV